MSAAGRPSTPASSVLSGTGMGGKTPSLSGSTVLPGPALGGGRRGSLGGRRLSVAAVDVSGFAAANFQPAFYLQFNMDDDLPDTIAGVRKSLDTAKERAIGDLQRTVHQRIGDFVQVTKELAGFEAKMGELHGIMNQLEGLSETLLANVPQAAADAPAEGDDASADPLAFAVPQPAQPVPGVDPVERATRINRVLELVDELDGLLAESTGRYILFEGADMQLATPAGSRSEVKPVQLYVLNDALLITAKKVTRNPLGSTAKRKHAVDTWVPFAELHYEDVKEVLPDAQGRSAYGLRIAKGKEPPQVLLFDSPATKKLWMDQIKRAMIQYKMEEAAQNATLHMQPVKERYAKKATRAARAGHRRAASSSAHRKAAEAAVVTAGIADLPDDKHRSLLYLLDDLDQASSLRRYDSATDLVEQVLFNLDQLAANGLGDAPRLHSLHRTLDGKKRRLAELLLAELACPLASRASTVSHVQLLLVLGYADAAREDFLSARSEMLRKATRAIPCVGDVPKSVAELGRVTFAALRTAAEWYRAAFADPVRMSGLVFWTRIEVAQLCSVMARLLFAGGLEPAVIAGAIAQARQNCLALRDIGLALTPLFDDCLSKPLSDAVEEDMQKVKMPLCDAVAADSLESIVLVGDSQVPASTRTVHDAVLAFAAKWLRLLHADTSPVLALHLGHLVEAASSAYVDRFATASVTSRQVVVSACEHVADTLFSAVYAQLVSQFEQDFPSLLRLQQRLFSAIYAMYDILTETSSASWLPSSWETYLAKGDTLHEDAPVSPWVMQMLPQMARITKEAPQHRRPHLLAHLAKSLIALLTKAVDSHDIVFSTTGYEQLLFDLEFLRQAWGLRDTRLDDAVAALIYRASHHAGIQATTKSADWYRWHAEKLRESAPPALLNFGLDEACVDAAAAL